MVYDELIFVKLGLTAILGLVIGIERELKRKPVGMKTSLVISIVSCLLTIVSIESAYTFSGDPDVNITMDPLRLAAQIVSGIGFLGAGVILHKGNDTISGLTTAAIIWGAAGVGIAVGAGFFIEAILGVILIIISVEFLPVIFKWTGPARFREREIYLKVMLNDASKGKQILEALRQHHVKIDQIRLKDTRDHLHMIELHAAISSKSTVTELYEYIVALEHVAGAEIETR
ncbi:MULTISPECIES: MgtC/SapB family protein [Jeotgalibacillus]|uniref:MgtC/SapB family protein n=1 Tax=Jeotgalibacillus TaxID=157226 RepID=UPI00106ACC90|nr:MULTISPECIES: MgtC/SapB family protein [Jeotgalibacillus]TFD95963.1 MgtC/SapB family protein [Jeotgalibacillus sp. R-1-5s-1]